MVDQASINKFFSYVACGIVVGNQFFLSNVGFSVVAKTRKGSIIYGTWKT